jgi:transcriptional regulator with XRE-family HTH domain
VKGSDIAQLRRRYELTTEEFGEMLGVGRSTVFRWEATKDHAPLVGLARRLVQRLDRVRPHDRGTITRALREGGWIAALQALLAARTR